MNSEICFKLSEISIPVTAFVILTNSYFGIQLRLVFIQEDDHFYAIQYNSLQNLFIESEIQTITLATCTVVPAKSDSDVIFCLQLLSLILTCILLLS